MKKARQHGVLARKRKERLHRQRFGFRFTGGEKTHPTSIKGKETHWLKRAMSPLHHKAYGKERANKDLDGYREHPAPEPGCEEMGVNHTGLLGSQQMAKHT
eukprot:1137546-Pelagomonas_calceolata.AAC.1